MEIEERIRRAKYLPTDQRERDLLEVVWSEDPCVWNSRDKGMLLKLGKQYFPSCHDFFFIHLCLSPIKALFVAGCAEESSYCDSFEEAMDCLEAYIEVLPNDRKDILQRIEKILKKRGK
ncbi:hypothetical protein KKG41_01560 [Patescibacteria group bacterium]|nr:hypothetical protein [Patescibacteria group bacterium]